MRIYELAHVVIEPQKPMIYTICGLHAGEPVK